MKRNNINLILCVLYILIGIVLNVLCHFHVVDEFWSGMGVSLGVIGVLRLIGQIRYRTNSEYKEQTDTKNSDERNRFLRNKAWAWAGYLFVLICGVSVIVLKIMGRDDLMLMASYSVCLLIVLYWLSYLVLSKKY